MISSYIRQGRLGDEKLTADVVEQSGLAIRVLSLSRAVALVVTELRTTTSRVGVDLIGLERTQ